MRRRRLLFRGGIAVLLTASLLTTAQSSQADDEPEWYPSLPDTTFGNWVSASQGGLSYARRAQQWFRTPIGMTVAEVINEQDPDDPLGKQWIRAEGYFVSPQGAPANYGYLEPMTVRSVGFGLMPVEATVQISQRRENGYPIPVRVRLETYTELVPRFPGTTTDMIQNVTYKETAISDSFNVQILAVKVDGVDLGLDGNCRTVEPAPVTMKSPEYRIEDATRYRGYELDWYRAHDPSTYYHPNRGGQLTGSMTIPPFTGCTTAAGDDLSRLLTLSVSGADNPVMARTGWQCAVPVPEGSGGASSVPAPPGLSNPKLGNCAGVKAFEYPEREDR